MINFEIKSRTITAGDRKGQKGYYAAAQSPQQVPLRTVIERIVRETSLSAGDVLNALTSLGAIVRDSLEQGHGVDLGELGSLRLLVASRVMNTPEEVTVKSLKEPRILVAPKKAMREQAQHVELHVRRPGEGKKKEEEGHKPEPPTDVTP